MLFQMGARYIEKNKNPKCILIVMYLQWSGSSTICWLACDKSIFENFYQSRLASLPAWVEGVDQFEERG